MPTARPAAISAGSPPPDWPRAMDEALRTAPAQTGGGFPRGWWAHLGQRGMLGLGFAVGENPPAADAVLVSTLAEQVTHATGRLGLGMAWMLQQMLGRYVLGPLTRNPAQSGLISALLAAMARGESLLALAISEPGAGAHPKHLQTRAIRDETGEGWTLDGQKAFVSNGPAADAIIVLAISGEQDGRKRFDAFLLDVRTPGLIRLPTPRVQGLAPLGHCDLRLEACRVPENRRIGPPGQGFETIAKPVRAIEDALLLGPLLGAMRHELEWAAGALAARGAAESDTLREMGALRLEWEALHAVRDALAHELEAQGWGEALAFSTVGARRLCERWQAACEAWLEARHLLEPGAAAPDFIRDLRLVLGIARGAAQSRQLQKGQQMLQSLST
jgi:acyl-CoA dehydrogenase